MRKAKVFVDDIEAGVLEEVVKKKRYRFIYLDNYDHYPVSLNMPISQKIYEFDRFPPFFEGVLPEGFMLKSLLNRSKIDPDDFMGQLIFIGNDLVGNVTVKELME